MRPQGADIVADDGRQISAAEAIHLAPATPSKIICVHLNYLSRVEEFKGRLPPAPTYFHHATAAALQAASAGFETWGSYTVEQRAQLSSSAR